MVYSTAANTIQMKFEVLEKNFEFVEFMLCIMYIHMYLISLKKATQIYTHHSL